MSLYTDIKSYIDPVSLQKKKTTNDLLHMPKEEFRDILALYIKLVALMKSEGVRDFYTDPVEIGENGRPKHIDFVPRDFDYLILSKGNNIMNDLILEYTIKNCASMVERYISSKLLTKSPQLEYFTQFQLGNFEGLEFVFNKNVFNSDVLFAYKDADGANIEVVEKAFYTKLTSADVTLIAKSTKVSDKIASLLLRLSNGNFNKYKKFVITAAEETYKGHDVEQDGEFMLNINKAINEQNFNK